MEGDNLCHFGYAYNADEDVMDEYLAGHQFLDHNGHVLWRGKNLTMHIDAATVGDLDGNPGNGLELVLGSQVGVAFNSQGKELWRDNNVTSHGQGIQNLAMGDFRPDIPGLEVVMLERIGPRTSKGRDANILVSSEGKLIWKEKREGNDYGWLTVSERITNWEGDGADHILSYRRTTKPPEIINGQGKVIATLPHDLKGEDLAQHADLCGDEKEEVIIYNEYKAYIFANGGCDLEAPPRVSSRPQNRRLFNATVYSGWEAVDHTFFTPGSAVYATGTFKTRPKITIQPVDGRISIQNRGPEVILKIWNTRGSLLTQSPIPSNTQWILSGDQDSPTRPGVYLIGIIGDGTKYQRKLFLSP
jgi:hypothetical protein